MIRKDGNLDYFDEAPHLVQQSNEACVVNYLESLPSLAKVQTAYDLSTPTPVLSAIHSTSYYSCLRCDEYLYLCPQQLYQISITNISHGGTFPTGPSDVRFLNTLNSSRIFNTGVINIVHDIRARPIEADLMVFRFWCLVQLTELARDAADCSFFYL